MRTVVVFFLCSPQCLAERGQEREKNIKPVGCVINGVRRVYFHFLGGVKKKNYECLHCHCPLTCPAGWKGFLTHPSHASAPPSRGGAGRRQRRPGIWINPPPLPIYQPVVSAGGQRTVESQEVLRGKSPYAVNPLIFQRGLEGSARLLWFFFLFTVMLRWQSEYEENYLSFFPLLLVYPSRAVRAHLKTWRTRSPHPHHLLTQHVQAPLRHSRTALCGYISRILCAKNPLTAPNWLSR